MKYICKYCNYMTENKFNYNRHTESLRHHKNKKKNPKMESDIPKVLHKYRKIIKYSMKSKHKSIF